MKAAFLGYVLIVAVLATVGCNTSHEDVVRTQQKAQERINAEQRDVAEAKRDANEEIESARARGDLKDMVDEKVEATKDIAEEQGDVDKAKVKATEDIAKAKRDAGETTGTLTRE